MGRYNVTFNIKYKVSVNSSYDDAYEEALSVADFELPYGCEITGHEIECDEEDIDLCDLMCD